MPDIFLYQGEANPNDIVLSDPTVQRGGGSPVNYTLVCASGSYVYTGQAATLTLARNLSLAAGAYVYTGQAATLTVARQLSLAAGAYAYVGNAASLTVARKLALAAGAYAYVGQDATLTYVPGAAKIDYVLACAVGAYVYTGQDATLTYRAGATIPLSGHFAFDEKKRGKRWKKEKEERDRRREVLVEAFQGLPAEVKPVAVEAITGTPAVTIDWAPIVADLERFHAALMQMAIAKAARQDEDDIEELIEMGVL